METVDLLKERQIARDLRKTKWWKSKISKRFCEYCGIIVDNSRDLTMDHIVPLSRNGKSTKNNIVACCKLCNNKKKNLLPMEWEEYLNKK